MIGKSSQIELLSGLLKQAEMQHRVTSSNIANINTPNYETIEVSFSETLEQLERHGASAVSGDIIKTSDLTSRADGNNVDLDREMGNLTKNTLQFETYSQLLISKLGMMRAAITGR